MGGEREGNGTTTFRDGAVYDGEYSQGLEHGRGFIRYPNGNSLDAEFVGGKIMGHGVFRCTSARPGDGVLDTLLGMQMVTREKDSSGTTSWTGRSSSPGATGSP